MTARTWVNRSISLRDRLPREARQQGPDLGNRRGVLHRMQQLRQVFVSTSRQGVDIEAEEVDSLGPRWAAQA
ncbi:MAG: hypothetical protein ACM3XZ_08490 [Betaproteobacteria bacterium]